MYPYLTVLGQCGKPLASYNGHHFCFRYIRELDKKGHPHTIKKTTESEPNLVNEVTVSVVVSG